MRIPAPEFESLVAEALDELPDEIARSLSNVDVVIEMSPPRGETRGLLGLYEGIPLTERAEAYFGVLPDRITLFQRNIEEEAGTYDGVKEVVRRTVIHEVAHHFGIDDDRLTELGWD